MSTPTTRDYSALAAAVSKAEVAEFTRTSKASGRFPSSMGTGGIVTAILALVIFGVVGSIFFGVFMVLLSTASGDRAFFLFSIVVIVVVVVVAALIAVAAIRSAAGRWARWLRQTRFAEANGLRFSPADSNPAYPGAIFRIGDSRVATDHFTAVHGRPLDFGNYRYTTGSGKNRSTRTWGFLALRLDRNLPHMVLDARSNNGLFGDTNLPASFDRDQVLSLEGDFDRHFRLYCPREYERDALYVFTPDLMALLIDNASAFDVEIVDQWLFVYSTTPFEMTDAATIERLLHIVDTVGAKTLSRAERYADDRAGPRDLTAPSAERGAGTIAPPGRRLRTRVPLATLVVFAGFIAFYVFRFVLDGGG